MTEAERIKRILSSDSLQELHRDGILPDPYDDSGYYLVMRAELDTGAWANETNARWFENLSELAVEYMLQKKTAPYLDKVVVDASLAASVNITMVAANNYY